MVADHLAMKPTVVVALAASVPFQKPERRQVAASRAIRVASGGRPRSPARPSRPEVSTASKLFPVKDPRARRASLLNRSSGGDGGASDPEQPPPTGDAPAGKVDVAVKSCTVDGTLYEAVLMVTNNTGKKANITVDMEWQNAAGKRLASDTEFIVELEPGKSESPEAVGSGPRNPGTIRCVTSLK